MKETTVLEGDHFVLLADFWDGFQVLEARRPGAEWFVTQVQQEMYEALRAAIPKVTVLPIADLRQRAALQIRPDEFVVTLDGGILFPQADIRIEITRASGSIREAVQGPYQRVARGMAPQLRQQCISLSNYYRTCQKRELVLCDDGIGTGQTISYIAKLLQDLELTVSRILTITNPRHLTEVEGIPVTTIFPMDEEFIWLNERDLYWGLPRSGLSIHKHDLFVAVGGVPYTMSVEMAKSRIGLPDATVERFREKNLELNRAFWKHLEELHGRKLTLKDCSRLQFFGDYLNEPNLPIEQLIEQARSGELVQRLS